MLKERGYKEILEETVLKRNSQEEHRGTQTQRISFRHRHTKSRARTEVQQEIQKGPNCGSKSEPVLLCPASVSPSRHFLGTMDCFVNAEYL